MTESEKLDIIEKEYDIPVSGEFREDVSDMCNLSQAIVDKTEERMAKTIVMSMMENGYSPEQIAVIFHVSEDEIKDIIEKQQMAFM